MIPALKHFANSSNPYINKYDYVPQWPFRFLISGASGAGKTNLLLNLILQYLYFDKLYIYAKDIHESSYAYLQDVCQQFAEDTVFCSTEDIIGVDELDARVQNLMVFDDHVTTKDQARIEDMFIRGRKKNASIIYLTQSYYKTPKNIRLQCDYIALFKSSNQRELNLILREHSVDRDIGQKYAAAVEKPFNFFLIDLKTHEPRLKLRTNFGF